MALFLLLCILIYDIDAAKSKVESISIATTAGVTSSIASTISGKKLGQSGYAGNFNGDSYMDLVYGIPGKKARAVVMLGTSSGSFAQPNLKKLKSASSDSSGKVILGHDLDGFAGSVSGACDFNGDGIDDIILSAAEAKRVTETTVTTYKKKKAKTKTVKTTVDKVGQVYVVFGNSRLETLDLDETDTEYGDYGDGGKDEGSVWIIHGEVQKGYFGTSVSCAGDMNGFVYIYSTVFSYVCS